MKIAIAGQEFDVAPMADSVNIAGTDYAVRKQIAPDAQPITERPADQLEPELVKAKAEIGPLAQSDEDVLSYVLFPPVAREFFEWRESGAGLEPEIVAAIAAALAQDHRHAAPPHDGAAPGADRNAWRMAGRQRLMRR